MTGTGIRWKAVMMTAVLAVFLGACGKDKAGSTETVPEKPAETSAVETPADAAGESAQEDEAPAEEPAADAAEGSGSGTASMQEIYDAVASEVSLPDMYFADEDFLMNYYGIDASILSDYVFASCEDAARVDSVILMRVKDEQDVQTVTDGLQVLLDQMETEMDNYLPEAHALVQAAEVRQNGTFIDLVISEERETILTVIDRMAK